MNISENLILKDNAPVALQIRNSLKQQVTAIGLKQGQILKKHITTSPALLILLKGRLAFNMNDHITEIQEMDTFDIPADVPHEVKGVEESIFLLIKEK